MPLLRAFPLIFAAALSLPGQDSPPFHASVNCVKALPGKAAELERFAADVLKKLMETQMEDGKVGGWELSRAVTPAGEEARCDYLSVSFFAGPPPAPQSLLESDLERAGLRMAPEQFRAELTGLSKLVSHERFVRLDGFGESVKGDYWQANFMKPRPGKMAELVDFERNVWKPLARGAADSGHPRKGWGVWRLLYPSGAATPYDIVTVDAFRDWDSIWADQSFSPEAVARIFPGKTVAEVFAPLADLRSLERRELYVVTERVGPAATGGSPSTRR